MKIASPLPHLFDKYGVKLKRRNSQKLIDYLYGQCFAIKKLKMEDQATICRCIVEIAPRVEAMSKKIRLEPCSGGFYAYRR